MVTLEGLFDIVTVTLPEGVFIFKADDGCPMCNEPYICWDAENSHPIFCDGCGVCPDGVKKIK